MNRLSDLNRARQLAYFLQPNKVRAIEMIAGALGEVGSLVEKQDRRLTYRPQKRRIKVQWSPQHLLQLSIYHESERYEVSQEASVLEGVEQLDVERLITRYVKHLVQISLQRNSLYVTLALCKFLYRYSNQEIMAIYDLVTQDPECRLNDDYCRSRKGVLFRQIEKRFGSLISRCYGPRGEQLLLSQEASRSQVELIEQCLRRFTPWDTECVVPDRLDLWEQNTAKAQASNGTRGTESHSEIRRIHALIHPGCFSRLTRMAGLEPPKKRLAVPRFFHHHGS